MSGETVFSLIGEVVAAGGGGGLVAYILFSFLGRSWIENQLAKDLEEAKSEISLLAARKLKLHDREYIVFPEVWSKLNRAYGSLGKVVISFRWFPDFGRMAKDELADWIETSDLTDQERSYFVKEEDKIKAYGRILDWHELLEAHKDFIDFDICLQSNRIFLRPEIKQKLDSIRGVLRESWVAKKLDWEGFGSKAGKDFLIEAYDKYEKQAKPLMIEIEELVQAQLFPGAHEVREVEMAQ